MGRVIKKKDTVEKKELKPMISLVPMEAIIAVAEVMTKALETGHHDKDEWRNETSDHQLDCMFRHLYADLKGERVCSDFGLLSIDHFLARAILYRMLRKEGK